MKLIAIEAATQTVSVALAEATSLGETKITDRFAEVPRAASEALLDLLDEVLARAGCSLEQIDVFATSIGPGMFTGVRTALATVQGLSVGCARPAVGVDTLAAVALGAALTSGLINRHVAPCGTADGATTPLPWDVGVLMDARRGEVYGGLYRLTITASGWETAASLTCLKSPALYPPASAWALLTAGNAPAAGGRLAVGSGIDVYPALAASCRPEQDTSAPAAVPSAHAVALLALVAASRGQTAAASALSPHYLRGALD